MQYGARMSALTISAVVPVDDMDAAVGYWTRVLGAAPTFVDGDRWAQFDVNGTRLSLAGDDRTSDLPGVMVKVDDIDGLVASLREAGIDVDGPVTGAHETRATLRQPNGSVTTLYSTVQV